MGHWIAITYRRLAARCAVRGCLESRQSKITQLVSQCSQSILSRKNHKRWVRWRLTVEVGWCEEEVFVALLLEEEDLDGGTSNVSRILDSVVKMKGRGGDGRYYCGMEEGKGMAKCSYLGRLSGRFGGRRDSACRHNRR